MPLTDKDDPHMRALIFGAGCRMTGDSRGMHRQPELYAQSHLASTISQSKIPFDTMSDRDRIGTHSQRLIGRGLMMSDLNKFTPGPWTVGTRKNHATRICTMVGGDAIHGSASAVDDWSQDASLIAAAPDLLYLLTEARMTLEMWKDVAPAISLCAEIDRAISKARGQS